MEWSLRVRQKPIGEGSFIPEAESTIIDELSQRVPTRVSWLLGRMVSGVQRFLIAMA
jgi:hypothetical protein